MNGFNPNSATKQRVSARSYLYLLTVSALAIGIADAFLYSQGIGLSEETHQIWSFLFCWLTVLWIDLDSRDRTNVQRSFDFTFLVFLFLPFYLPYYLIRTRRGWGLLGFIGFGVLYLLGTVLSALVYYAG